MSVRRALLTLFALVAVPACDKDLKSGPQALVKPSDLEPRAMDPKSTTPMPKEAPATTDYTASKPGKSDPECLGPLDYAPEEKLTIGGKPATLNGYKLTLGATPGPVTLGILASFNEATPANLKALDTYFAAFKAKGAQAILVAGDNGDSVEAITGSLKAYARSGLPVFVLIGNREPKAAYIDAFAAAQKEAPNLVNLNRVREVDFGGLTVLSLPGYHDPKYLLATQDGQQGCQYHTEDLAALQKVAAASKVPVLLVAHGIPHQDGPKGLDRTNAPSVNCGDPNLTRLLVDGHIPFGVFANIIEAGGQAVNLKGDQVVPQGTAVDSFYLNPGSADVTPWAMNDGTSAKGLAAIFELKDGKASYTVVKAEAAAPAAKTPAPAAPAPIAAKPAPAPKK